MLLYLAFLGIVLLVVLIAYFKMDTFISFILVAITLGLLSGMEVKAIGKAIQTGIGGTLGDLILIIGFGAMLGKLVAESGAAQRITDTLIKICGEKYLLWGLALAGFVIGIPLFYNAGFIIVVPLIFTIAASTRLPLLYVAVPMLSALSVAHGYLPPHPSPAAIASQLKADVGLTLIYGIIVALPAIAIAGPIFGKTLKKYNPTIDPKLFNIQPRPSHELPSLFVSLLVALMPVLVLTITALLKGMFDNDFVIILSEPYIGMLLSVLVAIYLLGIRQGNSMSHVSKQLEEAFKSSASILLVIAGAGALKQVLNDSGTSKYVGELLQGVSISPLVLGWAVAGIIRVCVGSATVAGLTAVGILTPLVAQSGVKPELMVLSIGAGSLMLSHLNDGGFWLFKEYFNLTIKESLQTWTVMETIVSVVGLIGVLILNMIL
jgi:Gnt-I system high-affinity gluconate transporter